MTIREIGLLDKNIRCDFSQGYIQDLSLTRWDFLARMNVRPNAQAYEHNHKKKTFEKISQIMLLYKYRKRNNNFATMVLVREFRASSPPPKKNCQIMQFGKF